MMDDPKRAPEIPDVETLIQYQDALLHLLKVTIPNRNGARGRYHRFDTARKTFIMTQAQHDLQYGKMPGRLVPPYLCTQP